MALHHHAGDGERPGRAPIVVCAQHLSIGYGTQAVVADVHVEVPAGTALALVGANGSGKSTLLRTVAGLLAPVDGRLEVFGDRVGAHPRRLAYVGQHPAGASLLPLRSRDVVRMGRFARLGLFGRPGPADRAAVATAMDAMGLDGIADRPLRSCSGGQRQRVFLAQALARQADLLVLDEPTSGLDAVGRQLYLDALAAELARGAAAIIATHDIAEASRAAQVLLVARRVVAVGPPDAVLTEANLLETFGVVLARRDGLLTVAETHHTHPPLPSEVSDGPGAAPGSGTGPAATPPAG